MTSGQMHKDEVKAGPKYFVNVEGTEYPWDKDTITASEIRNLGNIPSDAPVVVEFPDGTEHSLTEDEVIDLRPGHRYGRSTKYKRGHNA